jgi:hypothetical protein
LDKNSILSKPVYIFLVYTLLDIFCIGMGMGVPIFCILFGAVAGYFFTRILILRYSTPQQVLSMSLRYDLIAAAITLVGMLIIWSPMLPMLFDPSRDLANSGIPMILYEPRASFIGWMVLMILISPALQFLTALFGSNLAQLRWLKTRGA